MRIANPYARSILTLIIASTMVVHAQDGPPEIAQERLQEIKAQKSAFITQRMGFTPEEAQQFWPLYNAYDREIEENRRSIRSLHQTIRQSDGSLTEEQATKSLDEELDARENEIAIRRKYNERFVRQLGAVRTVQLYRAEKEFHKELLNRLKERGTDRPGSRHR
ncbi:MAG: hypothetical protein KDB88_00425 [Flavobacteriales bacterium]|nr:hypothetical protein [Flavobacteriales bacterium]